MVDPPDHPSDGRTVVVGGGLAGLAAAALLARADRDVVLLEQSSEVGGRARTEALDGYRFNLGGHALYPSDPGTDVLRELGVELSGGHPPVGDGVVVRGDEIHRLPAGPFSLAATGALPWRAKLEAGRLLVGLPRLDLDRLDDVPLARWFEDRFEHRASRQLFAAVARLTTYANVPQRQSAGAALRAVRSSLEDPVLYLDGGWQRLVDQVAETARSQGAKLETDAPVEAVAADGDGWTVRLREGSRLAADEVVLATDPGTAAGLTSGGPGEAIGAWAEALEPVRACCLDLALDELPVPDRPLALALDQPQTLTVHSRVADLAPDGGALVHTLRYPEPGTSDPETDRARLEAFLDTVQPGWREHVVHERFRPRPPVTYALPTAPMGGQPGRPGPRVPEAEGLYVAGDWVGPEGHLSGASLASARAVAEAILDS